MLSQMPDKMKFKSNTIQHSLFLYQRIFLQYMKCFTYSINPYISLDLSLTKTSNSISIVDNIAYHNESNRFATITGSDVIYPCSGIYIYQFVITGNPRRIIFGLTDNSNIISSFVGSTKMSYGYHGAGYIYNNSRKISQNDMKSIFVMNTNDSALIMIYNTYERTLSFEYNNKTVTLFTNISSGNVYYPAASLCNNEDSVQIFRKNISINKEPDLLYDYFHEYFRTLSLDSINFLSAYNPTTLSQFIKEFPSTNFSTIYIPLCGKLLTYSKYSTKFFCHNIKLLLDVAMAFDKFLSKISQLPNLPSDNISENQIDISGNWHFEFKHPQTYHTYTPLIQKGKEISGKNSSLVTKGTIEDDKYIILKQHYKSNSSSGKTSTLIIHGYLIKSHIILGYYVEESTNTKGLCCCRKTKQSQIDFDSIKQSCSLLFDLVGKMITSFTDNSILNEEEKMMYQLLGSKLFNNGYKLDRIKDILKNTDKSLSYIDILSELNCKDILSEFGDSFITTTDTASFVFDVMNNTDNGKLLSEIMFQSNPSIYDRVGGDSMKTIRRNVFGVILYHLGLIDYTLNYMESLSKIPENTNISDPMLSAIHKSLEPLLQYILNEHRNKNIEYDIYTNDIINKCKYLMKFEPAIKINNEIFNKTSQSILPPSLDPNGLSVTVINNIIDFFKADINLGVFERLLQDRIIHSFKSSIITSLFSQVLSQNIYLTSNMSIINDWVSIFFHHIDPSLFPLSFMRICNNLLNENDTLYVGDEYGDCSEAGLYLYNIYSKLSNQLIQHYVNFLDDNKCMTDINLLLSVINIFGCNFYPNELTNLIQSKIFSILSTILHKTTDITVSQIIIDLYKLYFNLLIEYPNEISTSVKDILFNSLCNELSYISQHYVKFLPSSNSTINRKFYSDIGSKNKHPLTSLVELLVGLCSNNNSEILKEFSKSNWIKLLFRLFTVEDENVQTSAIKAFRYLLPKIKPSDIEISQDQDFPIMNNVNDIINNFINISSLLYPCECPFPQFLGDLDHVNMPYISSEIVSLLRQLQQQKEWSKIIDDSFYQIFLDLSKNIDILNDENKYDSIKPIIAKSIICFYVIGGHIGYIYPKSYIKVIEYHDGNGYLGIVDSIDEKKSTCQVEKICTTSNNDSSKTETCCIDDLRSVPEFLAEPNALSFKTAKLLIDKIFTPLFDMYNGDEDYDVPNAYYKFTKNYLLILSINAFQSILFSKQFSQYFSQADHCKLLNSLVSICLEPSETYGLPDLVDVEECFRLLLFRWIKMQLYILNNDIDLNKINSSNSGNKKVDQDDEDDDEDVVQLARLVSLGYDEEEARRLLHKYDIDTILSKKEAKQQKLLPKLSNSSSILPRVDSMICRGQYATEVCGLGKIDNYRCKSLEGREDFASFGIPSALVNKGKWYYEVTIEETDIIQVGWADTSFFGVLSQGTGVGDDSHSWAYDGERVCKWSYVKSNYGSKWKNGDIVGCYIDLDKKEIGFSLNGISEYPMGIAFKGVLFDNYVYPCVSANKNSTVVLNIGSDSNIPLKYLPLGYSPISNCENLKRELFGRPMNNYNEQCLNTVEDHFAHNMDENIFAGRYFSPEPNSYTCASIDYHLLRKYAGLQQYSDSRRKATQALNNIDDYKILSIPLISVSMKYIHLLSCQLLLTIFRTWPIEDDQKSFFDVFYDVKSSINNSISEEECFDIIYDTYKMLINYPLRNIESTSLFVNSDIPKQDILPDDSSPNTIINLLTYVELKKRIFTNKLDSVPIKRLLYRFTSEMGELSKTKNASSPWIFATRNKTFSGFSGDKDWKDSKAISTPCIPLMESITHILLRICSVSKKYYNYIVLSIFNAWCITLRSPSMVLRSKGMSVLSSILNEQISIMIQKNEISKDQDEFCRSLLKCLAVKRLKGQLDMKLYCERDKSPCYTTYTLNLFELVTAISNITSFLNNKNFESSLVALDKWSDGFEIGVPSDTTCVTLSGWLIQKRIYKTDALDIKVGMRVIRGPDWEWKNQDNNSIGFVISVEPLKQENSDGLAVGVRWEGGNIFNYRWGSENKYDLTIVDVNDKGNITKKYPTPKDDEHKGAFTKDIKTGIRLIINDFPKNINKDKNIDGIIEFPQYNGRIAFEGRVTVSGEIELVEKKFVAGVSNRGWITRFNTENWITGTKYKGEYYYSEDNSLNINLNYSIPIKINGVDQMNNGKISLNDLELFNFTPDTVGSGINIENKYSLGQVQSDISPISLGTVGFSNGIHYWEINIDKTTQPGDIGVGIVNSGTPVGEPSSNYQNQWKGYRYVSYRAIQENTTRNNASEKIYGTFYGSGDTIGVLLNIDKGFASFYYDGFKFGEHILSDLGPAFIGLLNGKSYSSETVFYPEVCTKARNERISLNKKWFSIQGISIDLTLQELRLAHSILQYWTHKEGDKLPDVFLKQSYEYYKRWISGKYKRYPIRVRGIVCDFDISDDAFKLLKTELRAGYIVKISTSNKRSLDVPELAEILGVYKHKVWYKLCHTDGHEGLSDRSQNAWQFSPSELNELVIMNKKSTYIPYTGKVLTFDEYKSKINSVKWNLNIDQNIVEAMNKSCSRNAVSQENMNMNDFIWENNELPRDIALLRSTILVQFNTIISHVLQYVQFRSESINRIILEDEPCYHSLLNPYNQLHYSSPREQLINEADDGWVSYNLGQYVLDLKRLLFTTTKRKFFNEILFETKSELHIPGDEYEDPREISTLTINRVMAQPEKLEKILDTNDRMKKSVFGQLYHQMKDFPDSVYRIEYICKGHGGQKRCFKVKFRGEGVNDYGGPYRTVFEDLVAELQDDIHINNNNNNNKPKCLLPFFIPTPNKFYNVGDKGRDRYIFNSSPLLTTNNMLESMCYLGKLIGSSVRCGMQLALDLPEITWKILCGDKVNKFDFIEIDYNTYKSLNDLLKLENQGINESNYEELIGEIENKMELSSGESIELDKNHPNKNVKWNEIKNYVDEVIRNRIKESYQQLSAFQGGIGITIPLELFHLFTYTELEQLITGSRTFDVRVLKQATEYYLLFYRYEKIDPNEQYIKWFWEVLEEMNESDKVKFLRFVLARSRMPTSAKFFPMKISFFILYNILNYLL